MCATHPGPVDRVDWVQHLEQTLENFDDIGGHRCLSRVFEDLELEDALTSVVLPYLKGVGDRWEAGTIGVGQEHFASNVIRSRLSTVMQTQAREDGPLVVLACMPKEHHEFGLMAAALALSRLGWRTCYLGANTPIAELVRACGRLQPEAVLLSAHRPTAYAAHAPVLRHLATSTAVYVGARGASAALASLCDAIHVDADPVAGAHLVHRGLEARAATSAAG
jgi:methanogenic corrinoid protein MtbC1